MSTRRRAESFLADLEKRLQAIREGDPRKIERQHQEGKLTARERLGLLFDPDTFVETGAFVAHRCHEFGMHERRIPGDGVVTGYGKVDGRLVYAFAQDFTVFGGTVSEMAAQKICKLAELATRTGAPLVGLNDSGGARIQEGVGSLGGYADIGLKIMQASGVIPQISAIMGPCAGGAAYASVGMDFVLMVDETSYMFVTGPEVIYSITGQKISMEELGGSVTHAVETGTCSFRYPDDEHCLMGIRELLTYLPSNNLDDPPPATSRDDPERLVEELDTLVPEEVNQPYDVKELLRAVVDDGKLLEVQAEYAMNMVVALARFAGRSVGVVANQPNVLSGVLDIKASTKAARFVRFCDSFNLPIVTFTDCPGYLPGVQEEMNGIIRHGAKAAYAYCEATVPKVTVVVRKAYGGAYATMGSKQFAGDVNLAYPTAQIAVMGAEAGVDLLFRRELAAAGEGREALREELVRKYREQFASPYQAAELGFIDDVIPPRETRLRITRALESLRTKRTATLPKKHGNIPL